MSYNPHQYKHLFKRGLFDYPDRELSNWNESHRLFALNQEPHARESKKIAPGLILRRGHLPIGRGFSNYLIFEIDTRERIVETHYSAKPIHPLTAFCDLKKALALINLGYFYLTTHENLDEVKPPSIRVCNLAIFKNRIINLPITNRSAFLHLKDGSFDLTFVRARGKLKINDERLFWAGSKTKYNGDVIVYNSSNLEITNVNHPIIGPYRTANRTYLTTKKGKKYVICKITNGRIKVLAVTAARSKLLINRCHLILEVDRNLKIKKGAQVIFETFDQYPFEEVEFAVSIGPILKEKAKEREKQVAAEGLDNDPFLSNRPHREEVNLARGCLVKLSRHKLATVLVDGIPQAGDIYPGVTLGQLAAFVNKLYPQHQIAVCNDPANTLKAVYLNDQEPHVFGNTHYLAYRRLKNGKVKFWPNGRLGRKMHTMLVVK